MILINLGKKKRIKRIYNSDNNYKNDKQLRNKFIQILLLTLGTIFVAVGITAIFIPVIPTTPFLLLAAVLYAKSSKKFYFWLLNNKICGKFIKDYKEGRGIPLKFKILTIILLWITIGSTIVFSINILWVKILLFLIAIGVTIHIIRIKPKKIKVFKINC